jgi:hypothetical protein
LVIDSMPPATTTSALPATSCVVREDGGLHGRAAHLGQGDGAGGHRQAGFQQRLARRRLALAGHQAVAEVDVFDQPGVDAGAFDGGLDRDGAQVAARPCREKSPWKAPMGCGRRRR